MFDKRCDFALNRLDKDAIVCQSVTGSPVRLTRDDFASEAEFVRWKEWSDNDYHQIQLAGREDDDCLPLEEQMDSPSPSAEDHFLGAVLNAERTGQRTALAQEIRAALTERQYRRLCLYFLDGKTQAQIADMEKVAQQQISKSLIAGAKIVERFFQDFMRTRV